MILGSVLVLAPYQGLASLVGRLVREYPELDVTIKMADLDAAVNLIDWAQERNFDLIISRGGTAMRLAAATSLPVVEIPFTGYDFFRLASLIKDYTRPVSMIGFKNICDGVGLFAEYLDVDIPMTCVENERDVEIAIKHARAEGRVVVGDTVTIRQASEAGLDGLLITSGAEAVRAALNLARSQLRAIGVEKSQRQLLEKSLQAFVGDCVMFDERGEPLAALPLVTQRGETSQFNGWPVALAQLFQRLPQLPETIYLLRDEHVDSSPAAMRVFAPTVEGARQLIFARDCNRQRESYRIGVLRAHSASLEGMTRDNSHLAAAARAVGQLAPGHAPIAIAARMGTGATRLIKALQQQSFANTPELLLTFDVMEPSREVTRQLANFLERAAGALVLVAGCERLKLVDQDRFAQDLTRTAAYVVCLLPLPLDELETRGLIAPRLSSLLRERELRVPSLKEDITIFNAATLHCLACANAAHGKTVRSFSKPVLEALFRLDWPGNHSQLGAFIDRLVEGAPDGDWVIDPATIERQPIRTAQDAVDQGLPDPTTHLQLDLSLSLEEMESAIVARVLDEERGNQGRAAARLGIGRSTLWRKRKANR